MSCENFNLIDKVESFSNEVILPCLNTIEDGLGLKQFIYENGFIAGGCFRDLIISNENYINDIDIFVKDLTESKKNELDKMFDQTNIVVREFFRNSKTIIYFSKSENCYTFIVSSNEKIDKTFQIITQDYGKTPSDILEGFDIDCCKIGFDIKTSTTIFDETYSQLEWIKDNHMHFKIFHDKQDLRLNRFENKNYSPEDAYNEINSSIRTMNRIFKISNKPHEVAFDSDINSLNRSIIQCFNLLLEHVDNKKINTKDLRRILRNVIDNMETSGEY